MRASIYVLGPLLAREPHGLAQRLFGAHARMDGMLPLMARLLPELEWDADALREADADPQLQKTRKALERAAAGEAFRDAYRDEAGS